MGVLFIERPFFWYIRHMRTLIPIIAFILLACSTFAYADTQDPNRIEHSFSDIVSGLTSKNFDTKATIIKEIETSNHQQSLAILKSLLEGNVYYIKSNKTIVIAEISGKEAIISNAVNGELIGKTKKKKLKKVGINNKLRRVLNASIAKLSLGNEDPKVRKAAVIEMFKNINADTASIFSERLGQEKDQNVISALRTGINISNLKLGDHDEKLSAINYLSDSLYPEVRVALNNMDRNLDSTVSDPKTQELRFAIQESLKNINSYLGIYKQIENIFFGISLGSVLLLAAVGLAITFGVMGVINMAHGEMLMLGAYTTYMIQRLMPNAIEYSLLFAIPTAFILTAIVGIVIERGVIRFLYGRPLETLLATFGISLILQQAVRTFVSPQNRAVETPHWMSGSIEINPALSLTYNRVYIIVFALLVLAGLMLLLNKSRFGLQVRAVTQNRPMAKAMGIRTDWIDAFTFGLGSGIAGMAGVALSQLTNVGPNLGQGYIIDSFMVVVFGGVGNLWGTLFGAMTLGIANKYLEPFTGAVIAKIIVLVFIILFIQKKPRGMFALKGRSAET